ncbi:MAG: DUF2142 domain-containing protein [Patescibacteria group bacterium]|nr:DUF2142 domain-containing protein [Patescibacteria group bacterium]
MIGVIVGILISSYFLLFSLLPPFQTPDETGHYDVVYWLSWGVFPKASERLSVDDPSHGKALASLFHLGNEDPMNRVNPAYLRNQSYHRSPETRANEEFAMSSQAYNPPTFYLLAAGFMTLGRQFGADRITEFYLARFANGVCFAITIGSLWMLLQTLGMNPRVAAYIAGAVGLNPLVLQTGIGLGPDMAFAAFFLLSLLFLRLFVTKGRWRVPLLCSLILLCLTRIHGVILVGGLGIYAFRIRRYDLFRIVGVALAIQSIWYIFTYLEYGKIALAGVALGQPRIDRPGLPLIEALRQTAIGWRHTLMHFAGFLGQNDVHPFPVFFYAYTIGFGGLLVLGYAKFRSLLGSFRLIIDGSIILSIVFFSILAFFRLVYYHPGWGIGGRNVLYLFPMLQCAVVFGLSRITGKSVEWSARMIFVSSVWYFCMVIVSVVIPRYYV